MEMKQQDNTADDFALEVFSFGFKYGQPKEVNYIFDVRFLPNPYWDEALRAKSGMQVEVSDYVLLSPEGEQFCSSFLPFLNNLIDQNAQAGKQKMVVAIGCTGGRHRSVSVVERIKKELQDRPAALVINHRDIRKDNQP